MTGTTVMKEATLGSYFTKVASFIRLRVIKRIQIEYIKYQDKKIELNLTSKGSLI